LKFFAGEANLGFMYDDELVEKRLKTGDLYVIPSGSAFYFVNIEEGQRLHIICSIDPSTSLGLDTFHVHASIIISHLSLCYHFGFVPSCDYAFTFFNFPWPCSPSILGEEPIHPHCFLDSHLLFLKLHLM